MMTRWWVVLCVSVTWIPNITLQSKDNGKTQECCPCPKDRSLSRSSLGDPLASDMVGAGSSGSSMLVPGVADDCPCRFRDADSMGAPSVFFPAAVRAVRPFVNLGDSKENPDPLLHPEVNLASSVLETLREATDKEYEEALARDAARAADGVAAESARNMVTVIINPKDAMEDDVMSEASHVHETRCIDPPMGRSSFRASARKPSILLTDILNLPKKRPTTFKSWNIFDTDNNGAFSNVNERVVDPAFKENLSDPKSSQPVLLVDNKARNPLEKLGLRFPDLSSNLVNDRSSLNSAKPSKLKAPSKLEFPSISNLLPKANTPNLLRKNVDDVASSDSQSAPSFLKERYTGFAKDNNGDGSAVIAKPIDNLGPQSNLNSLKTPSKGRDAVTDLLTDLLRGIEVPNFNNLFPSDLFNRRNNDFASESNAQKVSVEAPEEKKPYSTEILDVIPSPSEVNSDHVSFDEVKRKGGINNDINAEQEDVQKVIEQNPMKTEILDFVPKSSEVNEDESNAITDHVQAKGNSGFSAEISELNDQDEVNNGEITGDTIFSPSDRDSQLDSANPSNDIVTDVESEIVGTDGTETTDEFNDNPRQGLFVVDDSGNSLSLRERIRNTLESLRNRPTTNSDNLKPDESESIVEDNFVGNGEDFTSGTQNEDSGKLSTEILDNVPSSDVNNPVNIEDLQQMSDSLLDKEKSRIDTLSEESNIERNDEFVTNERNENNEDTSNEKRTDDSADNSVMESNNLENVDENIKNIACLENKPINKSNQLNGDVTVNTKSNEMATDASERVTDVIELGDKLRSTLRQNIIQPTPLNDLNLFNLPPLNVDGAFNINNPLFHLFNARKSDDDNFSTYNDDVDEIFNLKQSMSPSTSNLKSILPPVRPLEDIHLDILQLKPLNPEMPTLPRLNMNSFKTKLAIPESLQLRPLLLESSVGNKKGVLGATLTFGDDKKGLGSSNMLQQASLKKPSILGRPFESLPSLDELREAMWENTQNLFNTPLKTTGKNVVEDTLRSSQVLTENLRVGAENTAKDFQRNLESTFKGFGLNNHGLLSSPSFRNPNEFFEEMSRRHEDVNDKLKGIHYDLSDRLETLRNNFLDDYRLPSLGSSIFPALGSSLGSKQNSFAKPKSRSSNISSKGKKVTLSSSNSEPKGKLTVGRSAAKNKLKMPAAASIPSLRTVDGPKFKSSESPMLFPREKPSLDFLRKTEKNVIDTNRPFSKPSLPKLGQSKVKISFSTTELPPILKNKARFNDFTKPKSVPIKESFTVPALQRTSSKDKLLPSLPRKSSENKLGLLRSLKDSKGFSSEPISTRIKAPLRERQPIKDLSLLRRKTSKMDTDSNVDNTALKSVDSPIFSNLRRLNTDRALKPKSSDGNKDKVSGVPLKNTQLSRLAPISWPKPVDDNFLTKVRETLKARLAGINQSLNSNSKLGEMRKSSANLMQKQVKPTNDATDMARSASNNVDVTKVVPVMKENTSYSCKMMCTKNT